MAVDERQRAMILRGAQRLIEFGTSDEDIVGNLAELGIEREEALKVIAEAKKTAVKMEEEKPAAEKEISKWELPKKAGKKEKPFLKKLFSIGRSYVPKLKTGGRLRVTEIIAKSPLDKE